MNVRDMIDALSSMPSDADVVVFIDGDYRPASVLLAEGSNAPAAEWPLYPYVQIEVGT